MKTTFVNHILFAILILLSLSCKKDRLQTGTVTDIDGNVYKTVKIGTQTWMAENLRTTRLNDGTALNEINDKVEWGATQTPGFCWFNYDINEKKPWGAFYNSKAVYSGKLAPQGWHIPTNEDWELLAQTLGGLDVAGGKLKEKGTTHWASPNTAATNQSGFTALPNGVTSSSGFGYTYVVGFYFSSTQEIADAVSLYTMGSNNGKLQFTSVTDGVGFPARCVKDN